MPAPAISKQGSELAQLFPEPQTLTIAGREVDVRPLTVGQFPRALKVLKPLIAETGGELDLLSLLADHGETVIEAMAIATGEAQDWLESLSVDEFISFTAKVIEVNADFFIRCVLPVLTQSAQSLTKAMAGRMPSSTSSPMAIP